MSRPILVIATKNYSSWSLRPWLLLRHLGLPFDERLLHLESPEFMREVPQLTPTRRVPVLIDGELKIWESLAICEYASELADGRGWPSDPRLRAQARALASEMHAGFVTLRSACPMNVRATGRRVPSTPELAADVRRINAMFSACRREHADLGPWLFGTYSAVDAMYAPVVLRFQSYGLPLEQLPRQYIETVLADPCLREWIDAARAEGVVIPADEAGA